MGEEIERKFLIDSKLTISDIAVITEAAKKSFEIKEYYFNEFTRLRFLNDKALITIKSSGTLKREEYEYEIVSNSSVPNPLMCKARYIIPYLNHDFELNIFDTLRDKYGRPFCLIEVELEDENEDIEFPFWIGKEVTEDKSYYGYNLFLKIKELNDKRDVN